MRDARSNLFPTMYPCKLLVFMLDLSRELFFVVVYIPCVQEQRRPAVAQHLCLVSATFMLPSSLRYCVNFSCAQTHSCKFLCGCLGHSHSLISAAAGAAGGVAGTLATGGKSDLAVHDCDDCATR